MENKQQNSNPFKKQMATCPFNPAHTFQKQKLVFHITRCKDKQKRMPYMSKCRYNYLHFVEKSKLDLHQQFCADRKVDEETTAKYQNNFRKALRDNSDPYQSSTMQDNRVSYTNPRSVENRSRSRETKVEESEIKKQKNDQKQVKRLQHEHRSDEETFSDCEQCQNIVRKYKEKIMNDPKISKLIKKYENVGGYTIL